MPCSFMFQENTQNSQTVFLPKFPPVKIYQICTNGIYLAFLGANGTSNVVYRETFDTSIKISVLKGFPPGLDDHLKRNII